MRSIKTSTGADINLDGDILAILETLYREITVKRNFERSFEDMVPGDPAPHRTDDGGGAAGLPRRKPVPELGEIRERPGRGTYAKIDEQEMNV